MSVVQGSGRWYMPVLGETYRSRRSLSASASGQARKATTHGAIRLPKSPRPVRTLQMFHCVKNGLQECMRCTDDEISRLRGSENETPSSPCQSRQVEVEKHMKQAERYRKRLEFHLFKIEELEENYVLHQQLREGVKTMAKAFISHQGSNRRSSMQNVERGHKECTQTMCAIEAHLEGLLGSFKCTMAGLSGYGRLVAGDICEMLLKYGTQKWRCRGRVGDTSQAWDCPDSTLKALLGEPFSIKVVEVRSLGKNVLVGERLVETKDLFTAHQQSLTLNLNSAGSVKMNLVVQWIPLDGVDECAPVVDVPRRMLSTPSRRQFPVRSMIEVDGQPMFRWDSQPVHSSSYNSNRFSMPIFPNTFSATPSTGMDNRLRTPESYYGDGYQGDRVAVSRRCHGGQFQQPRPYSVVVTSTVDQADVVMATRSHSVGAMATEPLAPPLPSAVTPTTSYYGDDRHHEGLNELIADLRTAVCELRHHHPRLQRLTECLDAVDDLLRKNSSRQSSTESILIESALEAFSFLESEDYTDDVPIDGSPARMPCGSRLTSSVSAATRTDLTMRTTDSGIGSITDRTKERRSQSDSRLQLASCRSQSPSVATATSPSPASTGDEDVDMAVHWHLAYTNALLKVLRSRQEVELVEEAVNQATVLEQLVDIVETDKMDFDNTLNKLASSEHLANCWRNLAEGRLCLPTKLFTERLQKRYASQLQSSHAQRVLDNIVAGLLDIKKLNNKQNDDVLPEIITFHRFTQFFALSTVDDYISKLVAQYSDQRERSSSPHLDVVESSDL